MFYQHLQSAALKTVNNSVGSFRRIPKLSSPKSGFSEAENEGVLSCEIGDAAYFK
jgi:hypothetical protein